MKSRSRFPVGPLVALLLAQLPGLACAAGDEVRAILEQNRRLQEQVERQQRQIDELRARLDEIQEPARARPEPAAEAGAPRLRLSGEAGFAFFQSGDRGAYPNSEFRVDDAKVRLEAAVWRSAYLLAEIELTTREANDEYFHVGELYVDFEDVVRSGRDPVLNLRVGRFYLPFGEEYQHRGVLANPLISHSAADIWGIDEGVQAYGSLGRFSYNLAVQNGGHKTLRDFNADKSVTARLAFAPRPGLRVSASALRTGRLDVAGDPLSEVWIGNGFFRPLGAAGTTRTYWAELGAIDVEWSWRTGHLRASAGRASYDDDCPLIDYSRRLDFHSVEVVQDLAGRLDGAVRLSELRAPRGYPLVGQGNAGTFFYNPFAAHTTRLRRLTAGLRYEIGPPLVWKLEYSWEEGRLLNGQDRDDTDLLASELAVRF